MSITTRVSISRGRLRRYLAVMPSRDGWYLAWANPTPSGMGHQYEPALPGRYPTQKTALAEKRRLLDGGAR